MVIFWRIRYPFNTHHFGASKKNSSFIHMAMVAAGLLVPVIPILSATTRAIVEYNHNSTASNLVSTGLGFQIGPTKTYCFTSDLHISFYSFIFLITVLEGVGTTLMILIFYILCKVFTIGTYHIFTHLSRPGQE